MTRTPMKTALKGRSGAFDLPSIITGVVVVALLTAGVLATIFGIIPFAQDNGTRQDISAVRTAEGVAFAKDGKFTDVPGLVAAGYLSGKSASAQQDPSVGDYYLRVDSTEKLKTVAGVNTKGDCYIALGKSGSGKIFWGSDKASDPQVLTPTDNPGCITADQLKALVASLGGFEGKFAPRDPAVTGTSTDETRATFTWDAVDTATGYRVESRINGRAWTVIDENQTATTSTVTANPSDVIDIRVTARNTGGDSGYGTATVKLPDALIANGGFENGLTSWAASGTAAASATTHTGFGAASLTANGSTSTLSQSVNVPDNSFSTVTFWARVTNVYSTNTRFEILSPAGAVLATPFSSTGTDAGWVQRTVDMTDYKGQSVTLRFVQSSNYNGYTGTALLDDVVLTSTPPVITDAPTRVGASAVDQGASIVWDAPSSRAAAITEYTVIPYLNGAAQAPVKVTGNPAPASADITGLTDGSSYTFTVSATNSAGTSPESAPSAAVVPGPVTIANAGFEAGLKSWTTTGTVQPSTTARNGIRAASLIANGSTSTMAQTVNVPDNSFSTLTFWARATNAYGTSTRLEIVSPAGAVLATPLSGTGTDADWVQRTLDMTDYKGQAVTVRFVQASNVNGYTGTALYDDLTLTSAAPVITEAPTRVVAGADETSASVSWTAPASRATAITEYTVTPYRDGKAQTVVKVPGTSTKATVGGLVQGSSYTFTVTATNSAGTSPESAPSAAVTPVATLIKNAGFEADLQFWTSAGTTAPSTSSRTGVGSATLTSTNTVRESSIEQSLSVPADMFSSLDFWYLHNNGGNANANKTELQILTPSGSLLATPFTASATNTAWAKATVDLTDYKGQTVVLKFVEHNNAYLQTGTLTVDDLVLTVTPPVITAAPTRVGATADDTTASLAWAAPSSRATNITSYTVTPYLNGAAQAPVTVTGNPAPTTATITGLTNGASYTFTVKATNSAGTSAESTPSAAVVPGPVKIANAGFEAGLKSWTSAGTTSASATARTGFGSATMTATNAIRDSTIAQSVNVPADMFSSLDFWYQHSNGGNGGANYTDLKILTPAGAVLATPFTASANTTDWVKVTVDLTDYKGQTVVLKFGEHNNNFSQVGTLILDDLVFNSTPPVITAAPTRVGATADDTTASLAWAAPSSRATNITSYTVTPYLNGVAQAPVTITGNPAPTTTTITGLTNGASYTFTVKATNSAGTSAESTPSAAVVPGPVKIANAGFEAGLKSWTSAGTTSASATARTGFGSAVVSATNTAVQDSSIAQSVNVPADMFSSLDFWYQHNNGGNSGANYTDLKILTPAGAVLATPFTASANTTDWAKVTVDLTDYKGQTVVLKFGEHNNNYSQVGTLILDDLVFNSTPPVITAAPTRVGATADDTTASLAWAAPTSRAATITSYMVTPYKDGVAQAPVTITGNPAPATATLTGLTNGASYTFTVAAGNIAGTSPASVPSAAVVPGPVKIANAGFEAGLKSWTSTGTTSASATARTGFGSANLTGTNAVRDSSISQSVNVPANMTSTVDFYYIATNNSSAYNRTELQILSTTGTLLATPFSVSGDTNAWTKASVDLTGYQGQTVVLKFNQHNNGYASYPGTSTIDDIAMTITPAAAPAAPTSVTGAPGSTSAYVSWTAPASPGSTITSYTVTPYSGGTALAPVKVTGNPAATSAVVSGLTNGSTYTFTVSATNGVGSSPDSASSAPVTTGNQTLSNGGFESGLAQWTTGGAPVPTVSTTAHSGANAVLLGNANSATSSIAQTVFVPNTTAPTLTYWFKASSGESGCSYDFLKVEARTAPGTPGTNIKTTGLCTSLGTAWNSVSLPLTAYKGQWITLWFNVSTDGSGPSSAILDDIAIAP
ncbi:fibronectin type III domain-containing protein [Paenarthrobacter sp. YJN-5]|uniref:beta strand repeat-containing protein n=1 Tax=Paenarthrobacter sp. YJN-5 TaxID=2735316 RepID=UPI001877B240|nr:fibronectin type III domain-containing protein [Paenarthrobacter sp. YJN-5]QOT19450.1 hypothetical protein HMI59_22665 [Paenarthrobacter sp. YJN-5]